jgi:sulfonate transport system substrate-binding protein
MPISRYLVPLIATCVAFLALTALPASADTHLRIGVQKYGTLVILQAEHTLEARLKPAGVTVEWTQFPGGPQLLEAMAAGSLDFGITGEAPPVFAQAGQKDLLYVGVEGEAPAGEAILVPADSPIKTLADLKGKRVALNKGSNVHYLLLQALTKAGLTTKDIQPIYLAPADGRAAFESHSVDAWAIWDPYYAAAQAATQARVLANGDGLAANRQFFIAAPAFAKAHPELIRAVLEEIDKTDRWAAGHVPESAAKLSPITGVPIPILETALAACRIHMLG